MTVCVVFVLSITYSFLSAQVQASVILIPSVLLRGIHLLKCSRASRKPILSYLKGALITASADNYLFSVKSALHTQALTALRYLSRVYAA